MALVISTACASGSDIAKVPTGLGIDLRGGSRIDTTPVPASVLNAFPGTATTEDRADANLHMKSLRSRHTAFSLEDELTRVSSRVGDTQEVLRTDYFELGGAHITVEQAKGAFPVGPPAPEAAASVSFDRFTAKFWSLGRSSFAVLTWAPKDPEVPRFLFVSLTPSLGGQADIEQLKQFIKDLQ